MNIFREMGIAMTKPSRYDEFLPNKKRKVIGYGMMLVLMYVIVAILSFVIAFKSEFGSIDSILQQYIPEFTIEDGKLSMQDRIHYELGDTYIDIDTDSDTMLPDQYDDSIIQFVSQYQRALLVDSEKVIIYTDGNINALYFSDIGDIDKQMAISTIESMMPFLIIGIIVGAAVAWIFLTLSFFFVTLILTLITMIIASVARLKLPFGALYKITLYARTTVMFLMMILMIIGITIPMSFIVKIIITMVYIVLAVNALSKKKADKPMNNADNASPYDNLQQYQAHNPYQEDSRQYDATDSQTSSIKTTDEYGLDDKASDGNIIPSDSFSFGSHDIDNINDNNELDNTDPT